MKFTQSVLFAFITLAVSGRCFIVQQNQTDKTSKIENGDPIPIENVPYQVMIKVAGSYFCGGALIEPDVVLTAAHCVKGALAWNLKVLVVAGTDSTNLYVGHSIVDKSISIPAKHMEMHPQYYKRLLNASARNDLALIKLAEKFPITDRIKPISLPKQNIKVNDELTVTGIGRLNSQTVNVSPSLQFYKPKVVDCTSYGLDERNIYGIFCHKGDFGQRTLKGDSGSPIVNNRTELVGIHKSSIMPNSIQISTNVYYYLDWIRETINGNFTKKVLTNEVLTHKDLTNLDLTNKV